jgi:glycosyltransferase involved in cell wall biosynthesis
VVASRDGTVPVSVVISTLDRPRQLARCLDALLSGSRAPQEVVVVDQGDPEVTAVVLDARRSSGVPLRHVVQKRRGLSTSQNAGVEAAGCAVVSVVDDDCVPDSRWVEVAAHQHAQAGRPLLLTGRVLPLPPEGDRTVALSSRTSTTPVVVPATAPPWEVGTGGNFSVHREAYLRVGGNDERLGTGAPGRAGNDLDLFHKLMRSGVEVRYDPDLLVLHERATKAEYWSRRWTYGFGVGVCVAVWLAEGDRSAWRVLRAWVSMRARLLVSSKRPSSVVAQARVLFGTVAGLWHGARLAAGAAVTR